MSNKKYWLNVPTTDSFDGNMAKLKLWFDWSSDMISFIITITLGIRDHLC